MSVYYGEDGYLNLLDEVASFGVTVPDRTGVGRRKMFDKKVVYRAGEFPHFSVRPCPPKMAFEEFWFMLRGKTQTKELEEKGIYFWKGNTSREFLDNRGLHHLPVGDMGHAYGAQWRDAGGKISPFIQGDQLKILLDTLENDRYSSRMVISLWSVPELEYMALTPCWWACQFLVVPDKFTGKDVLHLKLVNRSLDILFGFPFAAQQYRMFQMALANMFQLELGEMSCDITDAHVYEDQLAYIDETLRREEQSYQSRREWYLNKDLSQSDDKLVDLLNLEYTDFVFPDWWVNTEPYINPRPKMAV